ncbi:unnamed protein product [Rotaria sp. Silwood1]|nr:unnamed protein product [Rotaria sp. Silwood1]CAF1062354.1 unnamed protein product [Rotaria sp. Silwood1]CAF3404962.1 unnamed protein product [Rotaria sp. Silwood1]CAF4905918.1 unnamed protein product [Rotaria sp. Silwood1]CAF4923998.1 unnamed protein product [Rotaria sp. Silwood1]
MDARSDGTLEVMGMLLGKINSKNMIVIDSFALPVEGTETRVNAQQEPYEYMSSYTLWAKEVNRCKAETDVIEYQPVPLNKIEDFGVHCKQYYPLESHQHY